jgi:protein-disulfide isomerase
MNQQNRAAIFGGIIALGVIVAAAAIFLSTRNATGQGARFDYDTIPTNRTADGAFVIGDPDAPITIVEFADFMCPHCQTYTSVVDQFIEEQVLTGAAKFEFRMFQSSDQAGITFRLMECAVEQDETIFFAAHDVMFDLTRRGWNRTSSQDFANELGLNYGELLNCVGDNSNQWQFVTDSRLGQSNQVTGTPAVRIRLSDGPLQPISPQHVRGGPSYAVLRAAVETANQ